MLHFPRWKVILILLVARARYSLCRAQSAVQIRVRTVSGLGTQQTSASRS